MERPAIESSRKLRIRLPCLGQRLIGAAGRMLMSQFFSAIEAEVDKTASA